MLRLISFLTTQTKEFMFWNMILRVTNTGTFNNGISTLQSMYAPEYINYSINTKMNVSQ